MIFLDDIYPGRDGSQINNKSSCYKLYEAGCFGNKPLTWSSFDEILKSSWKGKISMRSKRGILRRNVIYALPIEKVPLAVKKWKRLGNPESEIGFNQSMPDEHLIIQGEITRFNALTLRYSTLKKPMNQALAEEERECYNEEAYRLIRRSLDSSSYENLEILLETWPGSVVEFSTYNIPVGNLHLNTIFWEVRNY